jgi:hypothetical protein
MKKRNIYTITSKNKQEKEKIVGFQQEDDVQ